MKKLITLLLTVVILSAMVVSASAATEEELLERFNQISISHYLKTEVENLAAVYDVTDEEGELLMEILEEVAEALPEDKGPGYATPEKYQHLFGNVKYPYTEEQLDAVMSAIAEACDIMGFTYEFVAVDNPAHEHDIEFVLRDREGRVAVVYDGDLIEKLGEVEKESSAMPFLFGGIGAIALAGIAVPVAKLKKKEQE